MNFFIVHGNTMKNVHQSVAYAVRKNLNRISLLIVSCYHFLNFYLQLLNLPTTT
jgi:hypothetical protein